MKFRALFVSVCMLPALALSAYYGLKASVLPESNVNWDKMVNAKNAPEVIRGLIDEMLKELEKNSDRFPELMRELEEYTAHLEDPVVKAFFHSLIAEMYSDYYHNNAWTIRQRTPMTDFVPEDTREWSSNLFEEKIEQEANASLDPAKELQEARVEDYEKIMDLKADSRDLRPTLYDFLIERAIRLNGREAKTYYGQWIAFRKTQPNKKAELLVVLDSLQNSSGIGDPSRKTSYLQALDSLSVEYTDKGCRMELALAKLTALQSGNIANYKQLPEGEEKERLRSTYKFMRECVEEYGKTGRAASFYNAQLDMDSPYVSAKNDNNVYPGKNFALKLTSRNIRRVKVSVYESRELPESALRSSTNAPKLGGLVHRSYIELPNEEPYLAKDTVIELPMAKNGLYFYRIEGVAEKISVSGTFSVSRMAAVVRPSGNGRNEVLVTDFCSGKPMEGVPVICYGTSYNRDNTPKKVGQTVTGKQGIATIDFADAPKVQSVRPFLAGDTASLLTYVQAASRRANNKLVVTASFFTDRAIYRPGQTVCFKGILYTDEKQTLAEKGEECEVSLRDANQQEVARKSFRTNEFGSFHGEFTLPQSSLTGVYTLFSAHSSFSFRVEEYKRPSFEVLMDSLKETASFGEALVLKGKAMTYSGVPLSSGKVDWSIQTVPSWWARYYMPNPFRDNLLAASGTSEVGEDGTFQIDFVPERPENGKERIVQSYELKVSLTDSKGETHEASATFAVGDMRMLFSVDIANQMEKEKANVTVSAWTLNRNKVEAVGDYAIYALRQDVKGKRAPENKYVRGDKVASGTFVTDVPLDKKVFASLPSNRYRLVVTGKDDKGNPAETERDFILYSLHDQRPPVETDSWMPRHELSLVPGETGNVLFGTTHEAIYLLYEQFAQDGKVLHREIVRMGNENRSFPICYKDSYGDGITLSFTYIRDGRLITENASITRKQPNRKLTIIPETFRDYLLPGSLETWKFRLLQADSTAVKAEVLASMYDASLDAIAGHSWVFAPEHHYLLRFARFRSGQAFESSSKDDLRNGGFVSPYYYQYDDLFKPWHELLSWTTPWINAPSKGAVTGGVRMKNQLMMRSMAVEGDSFVEDAMVEQALPEESDEENDGRIVPSSLRRDFAETAFFYPVLKTDGKGEVSFDFTLPESNTTWKLQLLAHTDSLKYGYWSKEIISNKPIMVQPNLPRFLREGDLVTVSTQLLNQSGKEIEGHVSLELFVPENENILYRAEKPFASSAGDRMETIQWSIPVADWSCFGVLGCRIMAKTSEGNDGEQRLLPVLSKQILVTESIPFYLMDEKETHVRLPRQAVENPYRVTLEMTANPVWYAVQALATLDISENEDLLSLLAVYYSNTLSQYIAGSNPKIRQVIDRWDAEGANTETLLSNLEKNSELKGILLEETPWVMEAKNETEQKQRLRLLFDMNRAGDLKCKVFGKLQETQQEDGGWGWMPGMRSSRDMTLQVLDVMARLVDLHAVEFTEAEKRMQFDALAYVDHSIQKEYEWEMAHMSLGSIPSEGKLYALLVRSYYRDVPETGKSHEAYKYYENKAAAHWNDYGLPGRAMIAKLMVRNGNRKLAGTILDWFKRTATVDSEKGMYWANNRSYFAGSHGPLETHCVIMSLFADMQPDARLMNQMKQWLIGQKRTQNWESTGASIDAVHALLSTGGDWLGTDNHCRIDWDGRTWSSDEGNAATGYVKVSLPDEQLKQSRQRTVQVKKEGDAPAWGAVYTQYFAPLSSLEKDKGVMNVEKKLFIEKHEDGLRRLEQVTEGRPLQVGDRVVVRLTIRSDRAMDYVLLKDIRSACMEPVDQLSRTVCREGIWYYQATRDLSENIYIEHLPEGTFVLEYPAYVSRPGKYAGGISTIQCLYAPEYISRTEGMEVEIK